MCLSLRSLVIRLVSFLGGLKWTSTANKRGTNLITKLLKVRAQVKARILLPCSSNFLFQNQRFCTRVASKLGNLGDFMHESLKLAF